MKTFKYTLFISFVVACLILISRFSFDVKSIIIVLLGSFTANLFPYLDYLLISFFINPQAESSMVIKSLFLRREYFKLVRFIDESHFLQYKLTINSAHFQVVLGFLGFYFLSTRPLLFGFSFLLSLMVNLTYRLYTSLPFYQSWFWLFKNPVSVNFVKIWLIGNLLIALTYGFLI